MDLFGHYIKLLTKKDSYQNIQLGSIIRKSFQDTFEIRDDRLMIEINSLSQSRIPMILKINVNV